MNKVKVSSYHWVALLVVLAFMLLPSNAGAAITVLCRGEVTSYSGDVQGTSSTSPSPSSNPLPAVNDHVVITEVYYDVDDDHGTEGKNEWIELYNGTGAAVNLANWAITDASETKRVLPEVQVPADCLVVITNEELTFDMWPASQEFSGFAINSLLGNGLGNTGDALYLVDADGTTIDSLSWGDNTDVFENPAPDVPEGYSLARADIYRDRNIASDWIESQSPSMGKK